MQLFMEILVSFFLITGSFFIIVGGIGMIRLPDLFMRLHAPTKASTLGLGSFLIASISYSAFELRFGFPELLITLLAFITAPVSANLLAQAAIHLNLRSRSGDVPEALNRPLPWQQVKRPIFMNTRNQRHPELTPEDEKK
ncbi:MAG: Na+/H+ antiporter subunit G [Acinetobacter populi]|jgi:multicomponent K+:H+ antiporter subunit G|uniref:Na+/H+ antiporter subunit G n=1 Tax=Acinetobacter populi TaxID=1582270 RepID=UPI00235779EA|nr:Na+/H+ antiporter subunit G [Acinetobacter populi]MCH4247689.1 Na+/H+ antiporter subunit G [Acinetobacter populi]